MTLSLFEGFSRIHQVRFRKMNKERSEWALKNRQNELAYQVTDAYYKLILERFITIDIPFSAGLDFLQIGSGFQSQLNKGFGLFQIPLTQPALF